MYELPALYLELLSGLRNEWWRGIPTCELGEKTLKYLLPFLPSQSFSPKNKIKGKKMRFREESKGSWQVRMCLAL